MPTLYCRVCQRITLHRKGQCKACHPELKPPEPKELPPDLFPEEEK